MKRLVSILAALVLLLSVTGSLAEVYRRAQGQYQQTEISFS